MTSQDFKAALLAKGPHFALSNEKLFDVLANKSQRQGQYSQFGPLYELFIYSFFIGLHIDSRIELPPRKHTTDFAKIGAWKRDSPIINFILFVVFSRSEEIGFSWNELEHMDDDGLENVLKNIVTFIEEYAHGGLNFLKAKYENDELDNSQYLFVDVLDEVIEKFGRVIQEDQGIPVTLAATPEVDPAERILKLIETGETSVVEFKETLRVNVRTVQNDKAMEHSCMKTLAAFVNSNGGTLLIGVSDKKEIVGIHRDLSSFGNNRDQMDAFQTYWDNLIENYFDNSFFSLIEVSF